MADTSAGFEDRVGRRLMIEQRRAVLDALRDDIDDSHTVGEIYDAAASLGWAGPLGELSLADLAGALLTAKGSTNARPLATDAVDEDAVDEDEVDEDEVVDVAPAKRKVATKKTATKKTTAKKSAAKKSPAAKAAKKATAKKAATATPKAKTKAKRKPKVVVDERMSLEEAVAYFVPLIEGLGEATMQDLEDETGVGRRKLRFHVGQLVKHGYLERHGMGRGTHYTVA